MKQQRYFQWYPQNRYGEPNLNAWWAVMWRRLAQSSHRLFWKCRPRRYHALYLEMAQVAASDVLTQHARKRLGELHGILGTDSPYRYTPEQAERIRQFNNEIFAELQAERRQSQDT